VDLKVRDFRGDGQFRRLVVSDLNGKLEKWNSKLGLWQNVKPLTLGQAARLPEAVLYRHTLGLKDKLRWTPGFTVSPDIWGKNDAFRVTGIGRARSPVITPGVPAAVQDLTVKPIGVGKVALEWSPSDGASSYTVKVNGTENLIVKNVAWTVFENLSPTTNYTFSVVPVNAAGSGPETKVAFGPATVKLAGQEPLAVTIGADGSLWIGGRKERTPPKPVPAPAELLGPSSGSSSESSAVGFVQQLVNVNGIWTAQPPLWLDTEVTALTTGREGVIWFASYASTTSNSGTPRFVQQIVNESGRWVPKQAIAVDDIPTALTTGMDGSIWVASYNSSTLNHIVLGQDGKWFVEGRGIKVDTNPSALTTAKDGSIWVSSDTSGTVQQILQDQNGIWIVQRFGDRPSIAVAPDPRALAVGQDGEIWVGSDKAKSVQRIVNENGTWFVKGGEISVDYGSPLTIGKDGSIWAGGLDVQRIVNERGEWFAKGAPIRLGSASALTSTSDGSIWAGIVANISEPSELRSGNARQIWSNASAPTELKVIPSPQEGMATLSWKEPAANGGTAVFTYVITAEQGATSTKFSTGGTSFSFRGLDFRNGPVFFTVAANNFAGTSPVATLLMGTDGQPIDTTHLTTGITTDGTWILGDGFDTLGQTYSWEALGSGSPVPFGNAIFDFGSPNQPHTIIAKGQTIPVAKGDYSSVNLAAASVYYGAQPNVVFKLNYTDGTTGTWTQSISDWAKPQNFPGEQSLALSYYNKNDATRGQGQVNLYGYSQAIEPGKTLASITLPNNPNVRILDIQMGSSAPLTAGVVTDGTLFIGGLDGQGNAYSWEELGSFKPWIMFNLEPPNQPGVIVMATQTIEVQQGNYSTLTLAATAVNGFQKGVAIKLNYTDGTTEIWTQSFSDWASPQNFTGETNILPMKYRNRSDGTRDSRSVYLYGYSRAIPQGKTLKSITLPQNQNVRILSIKMGN